jgi:hypothetical protein
MAFNFDKKLIIKDDRFYQKDGDTGQIEELTERVYIKKYKKNLLENCITNIKGDLKKITDEYFPEEAEIIWTKKELKRLLKNQLIENGKELIIYNDGIIRNIVILDEERKFIKMVQMEYGSTKGKRKIDMIMKMAGEGIFGIKEYHRDEFWFRMK